MLVSRENPTLINTYCWFLSLCWHTLFSYVPCISGSLVCSQSAIFPRGLLSISYTTVSSTLQWSKAACGAATSPGRKPVCSFELKNRMYPFMIGCEKYEVNSHPEPVHAAAPLGRGETGGCLDGFTDLFLADSFADEALSTPVDIVRPFISMLSWNLLLFGTMYCFALGTLPWAWSTSRITQQLCFKIFLVSKRKWWCVCSGAHALTTLQPRPAHVTLSMSLKRHTQFPLRYH